MKSIETSIQQSFGLHARPATLLVQMAQKYKSDIKVSCGNKTVNGKSLIGMLNLGVVKDQKISICIEGEDEELAYNDLKNLIDNDFKE